MTLLFLANAVLIWRVVRPLEPRRDAWMSGQSVFLLVPPVVLYLLSAIPPESLEALIAALFLAPLGFQSRFMKRLLAWLDRFEAPASLPYSTAG
jgi:hypothetical protein